LGVNHCAFGLVETTFRPGQYRMSLAVIAVSCGALSALTLWVLKRGYKLRH